MSVHSLRYIARVTIEFTTPFIIGGESDFFADSCFIADVNGLPMLPGTSIAGVLRHAFEEKNGREAANRIFGWQQADRGCGSRLAVSCGLIHDRNNKPVEGIVFGPTIINDIVLKQALQSQIRDHVRINHKGTAASAGKFDEKCVSAGHRFTFELMLEGNAQDQYCWVNLIKLLGAASLRLGGKTRRGFGRFKVVHLVQNTFDISTPHGFAAFACYPVSLAESVRGIESDAHMQEQDIKATISLAPEGFWIFGGGTGGTEADLHPLKVAKIIWKPINGKELGTVSARSYCIPGSSIKGAIAHRVAYHYNALKQNFADGKSEQELNEIAKQNQAVQSLFGYCKSEEADTPGQRGRILIDDVVVETAQQKVVQHVSLDRFTGGARQGLLFSEKPVYKGEKLLLELVVSEADQIDKTARTSLKRALEDLTEGRLPLGAGAGRGNGFFTGDIKWSDEGRWVGGQI